MDFRGFTTEILSAFDPPGINERWAAIQERLHPVLAALAEQISSRLARQFPRQWPLYEVSYRNNRFTNRGPRDRGPIDEYHVAFDRPPRGSGVFVAVSAAERLIVVALQLGRARKADLRRVWDEQRLLWQPVISQVSEVRFAERDDLHPPDPQLPWIERYLASKSSYLLAGFAYRWDDPQVQTAAFADQISADVSALFPLNEALMEQAEALDPVGAALLREQRGTYPQPPLPPIETIIERINQRGFTFDETLIRAYHVALQTRPLVILPGISGTGKTRLTRLYADALRPPPAVGENEHYLLVAVQPDWHNARDLLGYYNAITNRFHPTPFLRFTLRAQADPSALYFVCLDEMNLARPEYYLAPLLSALETDERLVDLGVPAATVETPLGEVIANPLRLPLNLKLIGTVNVDESTHTLSDKLLDRANVIELTTVDLNAFRSTYPSPINADVWQMIGAVHTIVARAGQPFGYRTITEMVRFVEKASGVLPPIAAIDAQLKQKVLPKLRGDDTPRLRRALTELLELALGVGQSVWVRAALVSAEQLAAARLPASAEKLRRMLERLDSDGMTDFYG
jgi:hypothetical protein